MFPSLSFSYAHTFSHRVLLISSPHLHPFGMALHNEWLYWTDWQANAVLRADKHTGGQQLEIVSDLNRPFDVHVYHKNRTITG